jgi:hypothetical protein
VCVSRESGFGFAYKLVGGDQWSSEGVQRTGDFGSGGKGLRAATGGRRGGVAGDLSVAKSWRHKVLGGKEYSNSLPSLLSSLLIRRWLPLSFDLPFSKADFALCLR